MIHFDGWLTGIPLYFLVEIAFDQLQKEDFWGLPGVEMPFLCGNFPTVFFITKVSMSLFVWLICLVYWFQHLLHVGQCERVSRVVFRRSGGSNQVDSNGFVSEIRIPAGQNDWPIALCDSSGVGFPHRRRTEKKPNTKWGRKKIQDKRRGREKIGNMQSWVFMEVPGEFQVSSRWQPPTGGQRRSTPNNRTPHADL